MIKQTNVLLCSSEESRQPARILQSLMRLRWGLLDAGLERGPPGLRVRGELLCFDTKEGEVGSFYRTKESPERTVLL